ncbi:MAG: haloacid dehalogenase type II [Pseudomonadota bacterium]
MENTQPSVFVFDAYGTLFDVHSAVQERGSALGDKAADVSETWRAKQLEYSWVRSLMGSYADFWTLTKDALDFALRKHGFDAFDKAVTQPLLDAYLELKIYSDAFDALKALKKQGVKTAILTNGSPDMITTAVDSAGIADLLDEIFCVDAVKTFKTSAATYRMVTDTWEIVPKQVQFFSSNRWDIAGATKFGFHTTWVNRSNAPDEYAKYAPENVVSDLSAL